MDTPEILSDESEEEISAIPSLDLKTVFLGGILIILLLAVMNLASEIIVPIVLAFVLKLVLQPVMRFASNMHIPHILSALIIVIMLLITFAGFATALSGPISSWGEKLPNNFVQLRQRFDFLSKSVKKTRKIIFQAEDLTKSSGPKIMPVEVQGNSLSDRILSSTQTFAKGFFITLIVLYFLLASGDTFLRRLVEILPRFKDKRQAVDISQHIEHDISKYLLTITIINIFVGIATGLTMWIYGIESPVLWGVIAFLMNYIPSLGPLSACGLFLLVGLISIDGSYIAFLPAVFYLLIHITESTVITPIILAKRFTLNPVLVIISLIFWFWMWGVVGAILAVPMLAIIKIICDRIQTLTALGHFLEG